MFMSVTCVSVIPSWATSNPLLNMDSDPQLYSVQSPRLLYKVEQKSDSKEFGARENRQIF